MSAKQQKVLDQLDALVGLRLDLDRWESTELPPADPFDLAIEDVTYWAGDRLEELEEGAPAFYVDQLLEIRQLREVV